MNKIIQKHENRNELIYNLIWTTSSSIHIHESGAFSGERVRTWIHISHSMYSQTEKSDKQPISMTRIQITIFCDLNMGKFHMQMS